MSTDLITVNTPHELPTTLTKVVTLSNEASIYSLEKFQANRDRFRGGFLTDSLTSFVSYIKAKKAQDDKDSRYHGFIDADSMTCNVFHNLLNKNNVAGHGDDTSQLTLVKTAAFKAVIHHANNPLNQDKLADFIEDWRDNLVIYADNNGTTIPANKAISAIKNISIKTNVDSEHSTDNLEQSRSSLAKIRAESKGDIPLPAYLEFACLPYADLPEIKVKLVLYVRSNGDKPVLTLRWAGEEKQLEAIAESFKDKLQESLSDDALLSIGSFKLGR